MVTPRLRSFQTSRFLLPPGLPPPGGCRCAVAFKAVGCLSRAADTPGVSQFEAERSAGCVAKIGRDRVWGVGRGRPLRRRERRGQRKNALPLAPGREPEHYIGLCRQPDRGEPGNVRCLASLGRKGRRSMPGKREKVAPEFHFAAVGQGPFLLKKPLGLPLKISDWVGARQVLSAFPRRLDYLTGSFLPSIRW